MKHNIVMLLFLLWTFLYKQKKKKNNYKELQQQKLHYSPDGDLRQTIFRLFFSKGDGLILLPLFFGI